MNKTKEEMQVHELRIETIEAFSHYSRASEFQSRLHRWDTYVIVRERFIHALARLDGRIYKPLQVEKLRSNSND